MFSLKWIWIGAAIFSALAIWSHFQKTKYPHLRALPMRVAAVIWFVFGLLEMAAMKQKANIRVDLLFTLPILVIGTLWCLVHWMLSFRKNALPPRSRSSVLATIGWGFAGFIVGVMLSRIPGQAFAIISAFVGKEVVPVQMLAPAQTFLFFLFPPLTALVMIILARKGKLPGTRSPQD
jgi:hypothetical protein